MKRILLFISLGLVVCLSLTGCGGKKSLSSNELKEEIARTVPEEGFEPFKEISPESSSKSYSKKRSYDLFAPVPEDRIDIRGKKEENLSLVVPAPSVQAEKSIKEKIETSTPAEEAGNNIVVLNKTVEEPAGGEKPALAKMGTVQMGEQLNRWSGECLIYQINWNAVKFGKAVLACQETSNNYGNIYHIIGLSIPEGRILGLDVGLYRMDAFIDKASLLPHYFYQYGKNNNKEEIFEIRFDWKKKVYKTKQRKFENGKLYKTKERTVKLEKDITYDGISVFYILRTLDLDNKTSFTLPVAFKEIWDLTIQTAGKRIENIPCIGKQEVYVLKPQAQGDEGFLTKGTMDLWITADNKRLPVYLEGRVPLGKARLQLISETKVASNVTFDAGTITEILSRFN